MFNGFQGVPQEARFSDTLWKNIPSTILAPEVLNSQPNFYLAQKSQLAVHLLAIREKELRLVSNQNEIVITIVMTISFWFETNLKSFSLIARRWTAGCDFCAETKFLLKTSQLTVHLLTIREKDLRLNTAKHICLFLITRWGVNFCMTKNFTGWERRMHLWIYLLIFWPGHL